MPVDDISAIKIQHPKPDPAMVVLSDTAPRHNKPEQKAEPEIRISQALLAGAQREMQMMHDIRLRFSVHEATGRTMVNVVDEETGKLIRQIPPEEFLNMVDKMDEMIGLLFDKKM